MPDAPADDRLILWRAFVPRWAHAPLSGAGAARFGGRWNPPGAPTIYAACELSTAWAEYNQGFVQHPALIVQLALAGATLADLTDPSVKSGLDIADDIHECEWRAVVDQNLEPATYLVRDSLLAKGFDGVIYPSFMSPGGRCTAIWRWNSRNTPTLTVVDPDRRLPRNAASWI